jgi:outer membrane protein insertion porin family
VRLSRTIPLRPRSAAALFLALALAGNLSATAPLAQESVDLDVERQVRDVEFTGNTNYKAKALRKLLRTRQSSFWKPWKKSPLRQDFIRADRVTLVSYYRRRGYLWARVDSVSILPTKKPEKSDVVFHLTEGPRAVVKSVRIEGAGPIPESTGLSMVRLKPGSPFDVSALESGRDTLMMEYADLGHVVVQVRDSLVVDSTRVHVLYQVKPGPIVAISNSTPLGSRK